ncbi:DNA gyrase inhibitor YacG [Phocoenobacter skyensis]|uniref:DNA gyrase inhibitor YacG n=1 Tax=Phocoenobacter skyensis TaxID=97481 RepID=A0A1H7YH91_9PAST|nr:DNA gyrase inhibitor YacG [Pasteurella skyensis]MDP8079746.1 DNA gyrase inhibitor YacG [Pasteurella skyensis]MDP8085679.1 DNA gyrase inhibitor YacG [Pasteurella skyensis]MDP8162993.1 DNA gyrase inhibitor YacG [Pasteurella skyensis]MDP8172855.1 DNA gyrase inhibitor YacG [Pasteurella skyensis]MDP8176699.1 DNA gyrase inhibitor YacG [Pasteurella skyensis]
MTETIVNCPTCETEVIWSKTNEYRPFCSQRCKMIDLGEWASEQKYIAGSAEENDLMSAELTNE